MKMNRKTEKHSDQLYALGSQSVQRWLQMFSALRAAAGPGKRILFLWKTVQSTTGLSFVIRAHRGEFVSRCAASAHLLTIH